MRDPALEPEPPPRRSAFLLDFCVRALRRQLSRLRAGSSIVSALNSVPHGFCIYDEDDRLVFVNDGFCRIYGQPAHALPLGTRFRDVLADSVARGNYPGRTADCLWTERKAFIDRREIGIFLQSLGDGRLIAISHQPLAEGGWAAVYEDVTERRRAESHLRYMAHHDALTGLPNRFLFGERLTAILSDPIRRASCTLVCLDLDGFKPINDRLGHAAGDDLLRSMAGRIAALLREDEIAARLGGDEFAVLMLTGQESAAARTAELRRCLGQPYDLPGQTGVVVGASIGLAFGSEETAAPETLMAAADAALYAAKRRTDRAA